MRKLKFLYFAYVIEYSISKIQSWLCENTFFPFLFNKYNLRKFCRKIQK